MQLQTPYADLLPPLSRAEFDALAADIKTNGVQVPVVLDEDGNVLDGHHRLRINPDAPTRVVTGLSASEKAAFVIRCNLVRRNLSPDQKRELLERQKKLAKELREADGKTWTNARVGVALGVDGDTVGSWLRDGNNPSARNTSVPDARVKVPPQRKPELFRRATELNEPIPQVAADFGISERQCRNIVAAEQRQADRVEARRKAVVDLGVDGTLGVHHGDFRQLAHLVPDESVDLIFTDPPYLAGDLHLYGDLGRFAMQKLKPGAWLLAYAGHHALPTIYNHLAESALQYAWTFCIRHKQQARFRGYKLFVGWKPVVAYIKPPAGAPWWEWFGDSVVGDGREKDDHPWQQGVTEAEHFIGHLCPEGGVVCDPFAGSGTSLVAALHLGRQIVGFEIHEGHVTTARSRLIVATR